MRKLLSIIFMGFLSVSVTAAEPNHSDTVILVTLDGMRWEEVFRGADNAFLHDEKFLFHKGDKNDLQQKYATGTMTDRRKALMPFFWNVVAQQGQLYGNQDKGSIGYYTNKFHFSYPGYSEILTGFADPRIDSNEKVLNPNVTVLEWLHNKPEYKGKVEAFTSWDVFPFIINEDRSGIPVNAGFEAYTEVKSDRVEAMNAIQSELPHIWHSVRYDALTMGFALEAMKERKLRFVYISLGETDDFAHGGFYDHYLTSANRNDRLISQLWDFVQNDERYQGRTTLLLTTDHGRGNETLEDWKHHGGKPGDEGIWIGAIGPNIKPLGEIEGGTPVSLHQVASTAAKILGYDYEVPSGSEFTVGKPITTITDE
ncbi:hypothetical protein GCM10017044_22420 [Kordiimonas sediminis]|uniref:Metalloenzyme domain-containing protein n=1 Tax=Kordiimonas sediminis TaxID=1735581 RepID=A0A919AVK2_9PROT|nr:phosphoglyceromutase [Kordiimonas sediminis]GHF26897.1 hypothetical protein GCM10017044_22420 [Kordiimonas sediminis]